MPFRRKNIPLIWNNSKNRLPGGGFHKRMEMIRKYYTEIQATDDAGKLIRCFVLISE